MKNLLIVMFLAMSFNTFAEDLICSVNLNTEPVAETPVTVDVNAKVVYAEMDGFRFFVTNKGNSKFEIEVFNAAEPSRSYASGKLLDATDELSWSVWSRDYLIDSTCKLAK